MKKDRKDKPGRSSRRAELRRALAPANLEKPLSSRSRDEYERGIALRERAPFEALGAWQEPADRPDPVDVLEAQAADREPDLVPIRYGRMLVSPFTFLRGSAAVMAWDLSRAPTADLRVQCCGDAHLLNFGSYAAPDRRLVFDLNDFDETLPAPFEWDVKRLVASFEVAGRDNGFSDRDTRRAVKAAAASYREWTRHFAATGFLDTWFTRLDMDFVLNVIARVAPKDLAKRSAKQVAKARSRTNLGALSRFAEQVDGGWRIKPHPPTIVRIRFEDNPGLEEIVSGAFEDYLASMDPDRRALVSRYRLQDMARKVVGVGSVGTEALMLLMMGDRDDDPLFLQVKQALPSVLEPYAGASEYSNHGQRVVVGQRIMQAASDPFLGWVEGRGALRRHFYLRQLRDMKGSFDVSVMVPEGFEGYARICGGTLARAHARSGHPARIAGYLGDDDAFDRAMVAFASSYADQTERDYAALADAAGTGRIHVVREAS
ncbi:MAG: DUF2252 domain-containing protein [Actinobacteria bacterium]|nr:DUF2252 domain-containing protein [Actinomycetota bacterium]